MDGITKEQKREKEQKAMKTIEGLLERVGGGEGKGVGGVVRELVEEYEKQETRFDLILFCYFVYCYFIIIWIIFAGFYYFLSLLFSLNKIELI